MIVTTAKLIPPKTVVMSLLQKLSYLQKIQLFVLLLQHCECSDFVRLPRCYINIGRTKYHEIQIVISGVLVPIIGTKYFFSRPSYSNNNLFFCTYETMMSLRNFCGNFIYRKYGEVMQFLFSHPGIQASVWRFRNRFIYNIRSWYWPITKLSQDISEFRIIQSNWP